MKKVVIMDGAVGTSLWEKATDKVPVWRYNIENPKIVRELQEEYVQAGADIVLADTFAANGAEVARCSSYTVEQVVSTAVRIAKDTVNGRAKVGLAIGPLTGLLKPYGKISHEEAKAMFEEQIGSGMQEGPDVIYIQTFMDLEMLKIAAEAASHYDVPLLCSMSFMGANKSGKRAKVSHTMMGNTCKDIVEGLKPYNPHGGRPQLLARPRRRAACHIGVQGRHRPPDNLQAKRPERRSSETTAKSTPPSTSRPSPTTFCQRWTWAQPISAAAAGQTRPTSNASPKKIKRKLEEENA